MIISEQQPTAESEYSQPSSALCTNSAKTSTSSRFPIPAARSLPTCTGRRLRSVSASTPQSLRLPATAVFAATSPKPTAPRRAGGLHERCGIAPPGAWNFLSSTTAYPCGRPGDRPGVWASARPAGLPSPKPPPMQPARRMPSYLTAHALSSTAAPHAAKSQLRSIAWPQRPRP